MLDSGKLLGLKGHCFSPLRSGGCHAAACRRQRSFNVPVAGFPFVELVTVFTERTLHERLDQMRAIKRTIAAVTFQAA
jgi:hypothetical protein